MLGEVVRTYRKARGWKQQTLADKAGLAQSYISMIENGTVTDVSMATLRQLSQALDVSLAVLLGEESAPNPLDQPPLDLLRSVGWSGDALAEIVESWSGQSEDVRSEIIATARNLYEGQQDIDRRRNDLEERRNEQQEAIRALLRRRDPTAQPKAP
jgi:transcriptional regulator with XRE-family HTH domain